MLKTHSAVFTEQEKGSGARHTPWTAAQQAGDTLNPKRQSSPNRAFDLGSVVGALLRNGV